MQKSRPGVGGPLYAQPDDQGGDVVVQGLVLACVNSTASSDRQACPRSRGSPRRFERSSTAVSRVA